MPQKSCMALRQSGISVEKALLYSEVLKLIHRRRSQSREKVVFISRVHLVWDSKIIFKSYFFCSFGEWEGQVSTLLFYIVAPVIVSIVFPLSCCPLSLQRFFSNSILPSTHHPPSSAFPSAPLPLEKLSRALSFLIKKFWMPPPQFPSFERGIRPLRLYLALRSSLTDPSCFIFPIFSLSSFAYTGPRCQDCMALAGPFICTSTNRDTGARTHPYVYIRVCGRVFTHVAYQIVYFFVVFWVPFLRGGFVCRMDRECRKEKYYGTSQEEIFFFLWISF